MKIHSIECCASPVSAAITDGERIISYAFSDVNLTHSQTLFPIIENVLSAARLEFRDIEAIGVTVGPGSFTGLRIGIASAKGLAEPRRLKCVGVSTLLAAAYAFIGEKAIICPVIDARCSQVYNALFEVNGGSVTRLCDDRALLIDDLKTELLKITDKKIILCCDAAKAVKETLEGARNVTLAVPSLRLQNAAGVGLYAGQAINEGNFCDADGLEPQYLKLPQAQRELISKQRKEESV